MAATISETDLYPPVKRFLEAQGYEVKGEVRGCDVVARRGEEPPLVVELKTRFGLELLLQAVARLGMTDEVYIAFPASPAWINRRREALKLCRRIGVGVLIVTPARIVAGVEQPSCVEPALDPGPYAPRKNAKRAGLLLREFERRKGDPTTGGQNKRPVMTAYRQDALRCALYLSERQSGRPAELKAALGVEKAGAILQQDVYGWFTRIERGVYALSEGGARGLKTYAEEAKNLAEAADAAFSEPH
ncbi:MAG: DUF2161 family putative PD-(D/E)XK-type phosphodiesterase [Neomegalonema sp.]|nr:DUF2161 family putative PD-(D/E)XK-type phosphodiesterase [Neomegalonema sp.]